MAKTYGNPHALPPVVCSANTPVWTDPAISAGVINPRKVHIDELRAQINAELVRRGLDAVVFTDPTITALQTDVRKVHMDELRAAVNKAKRGDCAADTLYCPAEATPHTDVTFTDPTITALSTGTRGQHISELRSAIATLKTSCICESEQCAYCADCGYKYDYCQNNGVACADHSSGESCGYHYPAGPCGSRNTGGSHPFKTFSTGGASEAWDGTVPWNMGSAVPGSNWTSSPWTCKCNPYSYDGFCTNCQR